MKENIYYKFIERSKKQTGFTLLASIITTSMLIIVSFVVANVALKQLVLSRSGQESQYALYNADSGMECAIFWDLKNAGGVSAFARSTANTITCNGQSITSGQSVPTSPSPTTSIVGGGGNANPTSIFKVDFPKGCAIVSVTKADDGSTSILSKGYNTCNTSATRRFERGIALTFDSNNSFVPPSPPPPPSIWWTLTVAKNDPRSGTITGNGINCDPTCLSTLADGTSASLTATPSGGASFTGWAGDCSGVGTCNLTMNVNRNVTAIFSGGSGGGLCLGGIDIGLRLYQGGVVRKIAIEPDIPVSPLRIYKDGIYGIMLGNPSDPNASKMLIQTPGGIMALCLLP